MKKHKTKSGNLISFTESDFVKRLFNDLNKISFKTIHSQRVSESIMIAFDFYYLSVFDLQRFVHLCLSYYNNSINHVLVHF